MGNNWKKWIQILSKTVYIHFILNHLGKEWIYLFLPYHESTILDRGEQLVSIWTNQSHITTLPTQAVTIKNCYSYNQPWQGSIKRMRILENYSAITTLPVKVIKAKSC